MGDPTQFTVPVPGGDLFVAEWGSGEPVVAVHGITASHAAWLAVARELAGHDVRLIAPDLRGRAASSHLPGPYGMTAHAEDLIALLDHLGLRRAVLAGHSMGAYVAATAAVNHPERVSGVLLLDGGFGIPMPDGTPVDDVLAAVLGPALERLDLSFDSIEDYFDFWRPHPALVTDGWSEDLERYLRWDLAPGGPPYRSRVSRDAVLVDGRDVMANEDVRLAPTRVRAPQALVRAERGLLGQPEPLIPDEVVAAYRPIAAFEEDQVAGTNHYTLVMASGAPAVATWIARMASVGRA